jgi:hypothetical protein
VAARSSTGPLGFVEAAERERSLEPARGMGYLSRPTKITVVVGDKRVYSLEPFHHMYRLPPTHNPSGEDRHFYNDQASHAMIYDRHSYGYVIGSTQNVIRH